MPPNRPDSNEVHENITDVRKDLQELKANIDQQQDKETYVQKFIQQGFLTNVIELKKNMDEIQASGVDITTDEEYIKLQALLDEVSEDVDGDGTIEMIDVVAGLLDNMQVFKVDAQGNPEKDPNTQDFILKDDVLELVNQSQVEDEVIAFKATMTLSDKVTDGAEMFYNKLPEGVRKGLESMGVGASEAIAYIVAFVADWADSLEFSIARNFSMSLREGAGVRAAKAEGITDQKVIDRGIQKWKPAYKEWMKNGGNTDHPDLLTFIQEAKTEVEKEEADAKLKKENEQLKSEFDVWVQQNLATFWPGASEIHIVDGPSSAEKTNGWKINLSITGFKKQPDGSFARSVDGERFFNTFKSLKGSAALGRIESVATTGEFEVSNTGGVTAVKAIEEGEITPNRILNIINKLSIGGKYNRVKFITEGYGFSSTTPIARLESQALFVNAAALDTDAARDSLAAAVGAAGDPDNVKFTYENGNWNNEKIT